MTRRIYAFKKSRDEFYNARSFYQEVEANPKANRRVIKKAKDILSDLDKLNGFPMVKVARKGQLTFEMWHASTKRKSKRNVGIHKRRSFNNGLKAAYASYLEWVDIMYCDI